MAKHAGAAWKNAFRPARLLDYAMMGYSLSYLDDDAKGFERMANAGSAIMWATLGATQLDKFLFTTVPTATMHLVGRPLGAIAAHVGTSVTMLSTPAGWAASAGKFAFKYSGARWASRGVFGLARGFAVGGFNMAKSAGAAVGSVMPSFVKGAAVQGAGMVSELYQGSKVAGKMAYGAAAGKTLMGTASRVATKGGAKGLISGAVTLGAGFGAMLGVGMLIEAPWELMRASVARGREMEMRANIGSFDMANSHLSNPFAKQQLSTERQRAAMFAHQSGQNFVAAMGQEAMMFHQ
jgi:hypothetical protein